MTLANGQVEVALLRKCMRLSDEGVARALRCWGSRLQFLDLSFAPIGDKSAHALATKCPLLLGIALTGTWVTSRGLEEVVTCSRLEVLDLCVFETASDAAVALLAATAGGRLKALSLAEAELDPGEGVTDASLHALARQCPSLTCLDVSYRASLTAASLQALASRCTQLRELQLTSCEKVSDTVLSAVAEHCASLSSLGIAGCTRVSDRGVLALARCAQLRRLLLWGCTLITDSGIAALGACGELRELNLGMCHQLSPLGISELAHACPKLRSLYAGGFGQRFVALLKELVGDRSGWVLQTSHVTFQITFNFINQFIASRDCRPSEP